MQANFGLHERSRAIAFNFFGGIAYVRWQGFKHRWGAVFALKRQQ
jgi:hypothetical protein